MKSIFLSPPKFPNDPEKDWHARLLHYTLVGFVFLGSMVTLALLISYGLSSLVAFFASGTLLSALLLLLVHRGYVRQIAFATPLALWVLVSIINVQVGYFSATALLGYIIVILMSSLFASKWHGALLTAASIVVITVLVLLDAKGVLPDTVATNPELDYFNLLTGLLIVGGLLFYAVGSLHSALRQIRSSEVRLQAIMRNSTDIVTLFTRDATILFESDSVEQVLGYAPQELVGKTPFDYIHPEDRALVQQQFQMVVDVPKLVQTVRFRWRHRDGTWRTMESITYSLLNDPQVGAVVANSRDVTDRVTAEAALYQRDLQHRKIFEASSDGLIIINLETGMLVDINPAAHNLHGYTYDEFIRMHPLQFIHPDSQQKFPLFMEMVKAGSAFRTDSRDLRRDGSVFDVEIIGMPFGVGADGNKRALVVQRDITGRKKVETALRESEARMRTIVENLPLPVNALDAQDRFVVWNRACEQVTGYAAAEIVGNPHALEMLYPNAVEREAMLTHHARIGGVFHEVEWRLTTKAGAERIVSWSSVAGEFPVPGWASWAVGVDVTERREAENALKRSEALYRTLVQNLPGMSVTLLDRDYRFTLVNGTEVEASGYSIDELEGKTLWEVHPPADAERFAGYCDRVFETGEALTAEWRPSRAPERYLETTIVPLRDGSGAMTRLLGMTVNITERRQSQQALERSEALYRTLVNNLPDQAVLLYNRDLRFVFVDGSEVELAGYAEADMKGRTLAELVPPETLTFFEQHYSKPFEGEVAVTEFVSPLDASRWYRSHAVPIRNAQGEITHGLAVVQNITERKQAAEALQRSEALYRTLVQNLPGMGFVLFDRELRYLLVDGPEVERAGYSKAALEGSSVAEQAPAEYKRLYEETFQHPPDAEPYVYEANSPHAPDQWYRVSMVPIRNEHGEIVQGMNVVQNITERKRAQEALERSEALYRKIIESLPELGVVLYDRELRYLLVDGPEVERAGYSKQQLEGRTIPEVAPPEVVPWYEHVFQQPPDTAPIVYEATSPFAPGQLYRLVMVALRDKQGEPTHGLTVVQNITVRKRAEALLQERLEYIELMSSIAARFVNVEHPEFAQVVTETLRDVGQFTGAERSYIVLVTDDSSAFRLGYEWCAEGAAPYQDLFETIRVEDMTNLQAAQQGADVIQMKTADIAQTPANAVVLALLQRQSVQAFVYVPLFLEERYIGWVGFDCISSVRDWSEQMLHFFRFSGQVIASAIDRQRYGDAIRQLNADLEHRVAERTRQLELMNHELESFAYTVSHDLRAPLRSIDGFSQILLEEYARHFDEMGQDYLNRIRKASQRMGMLIDDILTLSRITRNELNIQEIDLSAMVAEVVQEFVSADSTRQVEWVIAPGLMDRGDARLLRVVFVNLLGNAWKFTRKHGNARIEFGMTEANGQHCYFVRDNGVGFNMDYAGKLFGAFQRLHSSSEFEGTGIGLATVQRIIQRHGGRIWAESQEQSGATFYIVLGTSAD